MQIDCAAATELLDAPCDPLFEVFPPPLASSRQGRKYFHFVLVFFGLAFN